MRVKRVLSLIILVSFLFMQTSAYGQGMSYTPSYSGENKVPMRQIVTNNTSEETQYNNEREEAMVEAIFAAEYEDGEIDGDEEDTNTSFMGRREKAIVKRGRLKKAVRERGPIIGEGNGFARNNLNYARDIGDEGDGFQENGERKRLKPIKVKRPIPKDLDLGTGFVRSINEKIHPLKISGEYQMAWGYDWGDEDSEGHRGIWKNADFNKANLVFVLDRQYIDDPDYMNTYDKRIYDRFRLRIERVNETGLQYLSEMVVDPWSFVGKTDHVMLTARNGQQMPIQLRYWSNTQSTIDERVWLTNGADYVNIPELKVNRDSTHPASVVSRWNNTIFDIPRLEINRQFRPLRKLEVGYKNECIDFKVFPLADHDHAYNSDDPLMLSNKHIYWEPSPWLKRWKPALYFPPTSDFRRGKWADDIAFEARDSDFNFLTLLRGLSFEMNHEDTYIGGAIATPMHPWQWYDRVNSLPGAVRLRQRFFDNYYAGATYTSNYGFNEQNLDAYNHVVGLDLGFEIPDSFRVRGEYARSVDRMDRYPHDSRIRLQKRAGGNAIRVEAQGEFMKEQGDPMLKVSSSFTHMGDNFHARLSNYRNTRSDQFWGKHISFEDVAPDFNAFKIGDGIDSGRNVLHFRMENIFWGDVISSLFDVRFVRDGVLKNKIEDVYREELTFKPMANLSTKFLFRYHDLPKTTLGRNPYIITDYVSEDNRDEFMVDDEIPAGEDADAWTYSAGFHYDPIRWLGFEGIYERTNDHDTFPHLVLNDAGFLDLGDVRQLNYFLYGQGLIGLPPYEPYNIYKARIFYRPLDTVRIKLEYILNTYKHASGRDDNISHYGVEVDMDITKRLRSAFKYTRSQLVDIWRQEQRQEDLPFHHHNNIFAQLEYDLNDNNSFIVQWGEFYIPIGVTPVSWILNTVDSQRIVRLYLKGKF